MGPYCRFCNRRCFCLITEEWPEHIREAYRRRGDIAATCGRGQAFEKQLLGYSWNDAKAAMDALQAASALVRAG